jgi:hypothetical protein
MKLTPEINSLTRRLNPCRNVNSHLNQTKLFPLRFTSGECCGRGTAQRRLSLRAIATGAYWIQGAEVSQTIHTHNIVLVRESEASRALHLK